MVAKAKAAKGAGGELELPVAWGNVNVGDKTARIGFTASRGNLTVAQADRTLCGKRLRVTVLARASGGAGQESLPGLEESDYTLAGVADVKSYGVGPKTISAGLTFSIENIDIPTLAKFAKRDGVLTVFGVEDLPDGGEDDE